MKFTWKFQKPNWKSLTLDVLYVIDLSLWSILMAIAGAWAVTQQPDTLATMRLHGEQMLVTLAIASFGLHLAQDGLAWWWNRGASKPDSSDRVRS
ncbi:MAG: hypothetical protein BroJett011_61840 [Chloroflexota bacterium]|nr:MAG: hypothetical protein BroJett011_61840 [Chloroflexota bacterium]